MMSEQRASSESVLGEGLMLEGKVEGDGNLRLGGRVRGQLAVTGHVTIERGGSFEGEVTADRVVVAGEAKARISARSNVMIQDSAAMFGDVEAQSVSVAPGAKLRGRVVSGFDPETRVKESDGKRRREAREDVPA